MALFLSESFHQHSAGYATPMEAIAGLMESQQEIADLTEMILVEDYKLEVESKNLSEGETMDKVKGFFTKVWEGIKQVAKKVWARVKDICRLVTRKIGEWFTKVFHAFGEEGTVSKRSLYIAENAPRLVERAIRMLETGYLSAGDLTGQATNLGVDIAKFLSAAGSAGDEQTAVKKAVWEKYVKNLEGLAGKLISAVDKSAGEIDKAAAAASSMAGGAGLGDQEKAKMKEGIDAFRAKMKAAQSGAGELLKAANVTMAAFHAKKAD